MVTLLGFFCILANVALLEIFMPDLVGPVSLGRLFESVDSRLIEHLRARGRLGCIIALPLGFGCETQPFFLR